MQRYESVILLRYSKGWSIKSLAHRYNISVGKVKNILGMKTKKGKKFKEEYSKPAPRAARKELLYTLKTPCVHCGESDPRCIDFHHMDPKKKSFNVASPPAGTSEHLVLQEIKKCVNLCANCHRLLHCGDEKVCASALYSYEKN